MENKTDITLPEAIAAQAEQYLNNALELLKPYLIALSAAERQAIPKMSDKTQPFVEKTIAYSESSPQFVPPYLNVDSLKNDMKLYTQLVPLYRLVKQLGNGLDDTSVKAGAACYAQALSYYNSVKQGSRMDVPGAKAIVEDMSKRFVKSKPDEAEEVV